MVFGLSRFCSTVGHVEGFCVDVAGFALSVDSGCYVWFLCSTNLFLAYLEFVV
ncbi:hypothetical protein HanLR1_Chr00c0832g0775601 [Helianthus annuus]|nr:hypothetical protein HanLR1_Chr00c0832g0775601 [Helianthus annuus]